MNAANVMYSSRVTCNSLLLAVVKSELVTGNIYNHEGMSRRWGYASSSCTQTIAWALVDGRFPGSKRMKSRLTGAVLVLEWGGRVRS
jgi:hypothetical protein